MTQQPKPGDIVYFYRDQKYKGRQAKRILALRRWHGPALLVAWEDDSTCFVSHKGQLVKCAAEHVRIASSLEQTSAGAWEEAMSELLEEGRQEHDRQKAAEEQDAVEALVDLDLRLQLQRLQVEWTYPLSVLLNLWLLHNAEVLLLAQGYTWTLFSR